MSKLRLLGFSGALVAAALIGGTIMSAVAAAPMVTRITGNVVGRAATAAESVVAGPGVAAPAAPAAGVVEACAAFRAAFAANLGKTEAEVTAAAKAAIATTIDQAVTKGTLTKAAGDRLKARLAAADTDGCKVLQGWRGKVAKAGLGAARNGVTAAADALGLTLKELKAELKTGKSLKDVAAAQKVPYATFSAAVVAAVKADLDAAVTAGTIKQERADKILERLTASLADGRLRPERKAKPAAGAG
jgi:ribosomal protein S20